MLDTEPSDIYDIISNIVDINLYCVFMADFREDVEARIVRELKRLGDVVKEADLTKADAARRAKDLVQEIERKGLKVSVERIRELYPVSPNTLNRWRHDKPNAHD